LAAVAAATLVRSFLPAALAVAARGLVNAVVDAVSTAERVIGPVVPWLLLGLGLTVLEGTLHVANRYFTHRLRDDLNYRLTGDLLEHAAKLELAYFEDPRSQDVLERAKREPAEHVAKFVTELLAAAGNVLQVFSLVAILALIEPLILLVIVLFALPFAWFQVQLALRRYAIEHLRTTKRRWSNYFVAALTDRTNVSEVKLLGLAPHLIERFRALMGEFRDQDGAVYARDLRGGSLFVLLTTAASYAMLLRVALRVVAGSLTLGDLAIFGGATTRLRVALEGLVGSLSGLLERTLHIANVTAFLAARPAAIGAGKTVPAGGGAIELVRVGFAYPGAVEPALRSISLAIGAGETVAFVGENGAGKSTLVKLIARLYEPDQGTIRLDGVDLRELDGDELRSRIAFVFQNFGRYEASAADNIAYGDWRRLLGERERVREIARLAGVEELLASLPDGFDTQLGRTFGQVDLSGGEWQRIAVARAFARDARLLILDEPTSNLDARAEYELFLRFRQLAHGRTTIVVSHRFSTVSMADRIFVLDRGRIVESGTHRELLARNGSYAQLYELQRRALGRGGEDP
ncbi:MAG TPA: ABC transporter ATP-binding protein, partial [Thermoanaerobaculia bacterium]|nr:ABC transporter ATP-binding protein [Thermoanaerobaculia bacterium]